ncbi:MAG: hypothetical protein AB7F75_04885 [Planctomycetota bacterium]
MKRLLILGLLILIAGESFLLVRETGQASRGLVDSFLTRSASVRDRLSLKLEMAEAMVDTLAQSPVDQLESRIREWALVNPEIDTLGICYAPFARDPSRRLYGPRFRRQGGTLSEERLDFQVDYTLEGYTPYQKAMASTGLHWCEAHIDPVSQNRVLQVCRTIPGPEGRPLGYLYLQLNAETLTHDLDFLGSTTTGYYILASVSGPILSHPQRELAKNLQNLDDHLDIRQFHEDGGVLVGEDPFFHRPVQLLEHRLESQGLRLLCFQERNQPVLQQAGLRRGLYRLITEFLALGVILLAFRAFAARSPSPASLWRLSAALSGVLVAGTGGIWAIDHQARTELDLDFDGNRIVNGYGELSQFKRDHIRGSLNARNSLPLFIPSGLFIQTIEFSDFNNVQLTGYVWQKYQDGMPQDIRRGFTFPDSIGAVIEPAYERREGDQTVVGWYFEIVIREQFDFQKYPFDAKKMKIRMWHKDFEKNIVLVPDLESYTSLNPHTLPGLERNVLSEGWDFESTFFSFRPNAYNTNFGMEDYEGQSEFPELYYFVVLKRSFIGPFISNFAPLLVIALILFFSVMGLTRNSTHAGLLGFTVSGNISVIAALFFGIVYSHTSLRSSLPVKDIFYLEYFYFALYLLLIIVSFNAFLVAWKGEEGRLLRHDNRLFKVAFWPSLWLPIYMATLFVFY